MAPPTRRLNISRFCGEGVPPTPTRADNIGQGAAPLKAPSSLVLSLMDRSRTVGTVSVSGL
jgi:hypothetical protein